MNLILFFVSVLVLITLLDLVEPATGQSLKPKHTVDSMSGACEMNNRHIDTMVQELKAGDERVFIISRRNVREKPVVDRARLSSAVGILTQAKDISMDRIVYGTGKPVAGEQGRLDFYVGSEYFLRSFAAHGKHLCLQCCPTLGHPTSKRRKNSRRSK